MNDSEDRLTPIETRLSSWQVSVPSDPNLRQQVLRRIDIMESQGEGRSFPGRILDWVALNQLPAAIFACAAAILICAASIFTIGRANRDERMSHAYFVLINPVARVAADNITSNGEPSVVDMLSWMKDRFDLSREQFTQLVVLHEDYNDRLMTLYRELSAIQSQYKTFDDQRMNNDMIDFMALYDLLQKRDSLRRDSVTTSNQLVELTLRVLTPQQKREFLSLMESSKSGKETPKVSPETHAGA
ncbi:MAG TPA: hypothetical protein PKI32_04905 [Opitutales bacterium]|nr:hypothetical protein [Opitutales bacterium]